MDSHQRDFLFAPCSTGSPQSPVCFEYRMPSSYLEANLPLFRSAPKPGILSVGTTSSTLAAQIPYVVPFDRLLSCSNKFSDAWAPSKSLGSASIPVQTIHNSPDPDIRQGTYQRTGVTAPVYAPFRPPTRRSVHSPICATVASSSVFATDKHTEISQVYQGLSPPIMAATPYRSERTTGDMSTAYIPSGPVYASHAPQSLTSKDMQPAPAFQRFDRHAPASLSPMPPPAPQKTSAVRPTRNRIQSCNRFGCRYQSIFPGNVGRHFTYTCEQRNQAERDYADLLTTCHLCTPKRKFTRPDVLRKHIRQNHFNANLPKPKVKDSRKRGPQAASRTYTDPRKFYGSY